MSYHDDYEADTCFDEYQRREEIKEDAESGYWETKDGGIIHVSKMETSHIKNCIRFIERNDKTDMYYPWIVRFKEELKARGEME